MKEPVWVLRSVIEAVHEIQLTEHGGASGLRDAGLLDSAISRPLNLRAYGRADLCRLAAAYASGIVRNHPFNDGNKRTGFLAAYLFLRLNGLDLTAMEAGAAGAMLALASGEVTEEEFADWLRSNTKASIAGQ